MPDFLFVIKNREVLKKKQRQIRNICFLTRPQFDFIELFRKLIAPEPNRSPRKKGKRNSRGGAAEIKKMAEFGCEIPDTAGLPDIPFQLQPAISEGDFAERAASYIGITPGRRFIMKTIQEETA